MGFKTHTVPVLLSAIALSSCAKPTQPPVAPPAPAPAPLKVETPADLSPVPAPKDLVLIGRAERFEQATATVARWMNLPFDIHMLDQLGPGLSQTLKTDAPIEVAVALADSSDVEVAQPYAVFSVGVTSLEAAHQLFEKFERHMEQTAPGVWMTVDESPVTCAVAASVGRAEARVVCGERKLDVQNLLPYATRGLPLENMGSSDVHVELKLAPIRERYGTKLKQGKALVVPLIMHETGISDPRLSRPVSDILYALGDEVVDVIDDLDRILLDGRIAQSPDRVDVSTTLDFGRARSWVAQVAADAGKHAGPAPASFFELPGDSKMASYMSSQNPKMYEGLMHRLSSLVDGLLAHIDVAAKARDDFARSLDQANAARFSAAACGGVPGDGSIDGEGYKLDLLASYGPWYVCVYDQQPAATITALFDSTSKVVEDRQFRKVFDAKTVGLKRQAVAAGMPAGTVGYEFTLDSEALVKGLKKLMVKDSGKSADSAPKKPTKAGASKLYIYVVPDGTRTLFGMGTQLSQLQSHLLGLKKAAPDGRVGANPELAWLHQASTVGGGYFSIASFMKAFEKGVAASRARLGHKDAGPAPDALLSAPHHGQTPIPITWAVKGSQAAPKVEATVRLDRAVFEDAFSIGSQYALGLARNRLIQIEPKPE